MEIVQEVLNTYFKPPTQPHKKTIFHYDFPDFVRYIQILPTLAKLAFSIISRGLDMWKDIGPPSRVPIGKSGFVS